MICEPSETGIFGLPRRSGRPQGGSEGALASRREVGKICPAVRASGWTVGRRLPSREEIRSIPWSAHRIPHPPPSIFTRVGTFYEECVNNGRPSRRLPPVSRDNLIYSPKGKLIYPYLISSINVPA